MKKRILFGVTFFVGILLLTISLKNDVLAKKLPQGDCTNNYACTPTWDVCQLADCSVWAMYRP